MPRESIGMTREEVRKLLSETRWVVLGSLGPAGEPHGCIVSCVLVDDKLCFAVPPGSEAARDIVLLRSLREALDALAGDAFAAAFDRSTNQDDYRWGRLHRIVFDHQLGAPFSVPAAGGFSHLAAGLPGISRSGGFGVVDASHHDVRASGAYAWPSSSCSMKRPTRVPASIVVRMKTASNMIAK